MRKLKGLILILIVSMTVMLFNQKTLASPATFYTMTLNAKGRYVRTQDAYLPDKTNMSLGLKAPEDMIFDDDNHLWIADTGNARIVKYDTYTNSVLGTLAYSEFVTPKGVFVSSRGIYVADSTAKAVFRFDLDMNFVEKYTEPTAISFGDTPFAPSKIVVDNRGNMYIYGEGVNSGIIQLSNRGEFLGYFTTNKIRLNPIQQFYQLIFSQEQFDDIAKRDPATFSSLFIDKNSMIYTTTMSTRFNAVKKHNTQGGNIFDQTLSGDDARDIYVDAQGIIYAGMQSGTIFVYDQQGRFIFSFGAGSSSTNEDIAGIFSKLAAIAIRNDGRIFALDDQKAFLQSFEPTDYANKIYEAINLYETRQYEASIDAWNEVLELNQMSVIAHNKIGESYLQIEMYEEAMKHFKLAGNRDGYSIASWEVRNVAIQNSLGLVIILGVSLFAIYTVLKYVDKKTGTYVMPNGETAHGPGKISTYMTPVKNVFKVKYIADLLMVFKVMRHPVDSFYDIKVGKKGSMIAALTIYVLLFFIFINYSSNKGFIYQYVAPEDLDITALILGYFSLTILFVITNYLDTSINDGIGTLKNIFLMFVYALGPLLIAFTVTTMLSYVLTQDEVFFLDITMNIGWVWTGILIFIGISETHQYTGKQTARSIVMSIVFLLILAIVLIIIISMWQQLYLFIEAIVKEAIRNVTN